MPKTPFPVVWSVCWQTRDQDHPWRIEHLGPITLAAAIKVAEAKVAEAHRYRVYIRRTGSIGGARLHTVVTKSGAKRHTDAAQLYRRMKAKAERAKKRFDWTSYWRRLAI